MLDSKALEERSGRVESIFDPLIVTVGGIPRLIGGRRRCQVWSLSSQCALILSLRVGELGLGDRRTHSLTVFGHHLDLFFHAVTGLGCVSTGPLTQAGTLDVNGNCGDVDCTAHTQLPCSHCALWSSPRGHVQRGTQSTCWRIGHFSGGGNYRSR